MFTAALITTRKGRRKQPKCPLVDKRISKMQPRHKTEQDSGLKRDGVLALATEWAKREDVTLSETS